ncbi:DNA polymerase IV [Streptococcus parauberis]|uniref:DNA polymerase IV n=1 Tax=Streptococcus parauberis TaxID=1348 RepID=A0A854W7X6_9STRE|nr:Y-family DNA polymerase [Streptococcus parauberis]PCH12353.1 DNA polymerase IV [Streptococcus parauberis]
MSYIDYSREPKSDIAFVDMKSFYASVECVERGLDPLTTSLCVMSRADNSNGLILASSPTFKRIFGKSNVGRSYDLPFDIQTRRFNYHVAKREGWDVTPALVKYIEARARHTYVVPPRMDIYIEKNIAIQHIFQEFASPKDILAYSIDEGFLDLTSSLNYFVKDKEQSNREKLDAVAKRIQYRVWKETKIISTVGLSNANPLLAKLALDNEAKHTQTMLANWSYEDVPTKVWNIKKMTDFWGIGSRTEKRLLAMGITSIKQLANSNPDLLKKEFGVIGLQLWFHANGVDESNIHHPYRPRSTGIGNSQILPRDYLFQSEIELVLSEMAEHVAKRLRARKKKTTVIAIHVSFSKGQDIKSINSQQKVDPTQSTKKVINTVLSLFRKHYYGGAVRQIGVRCDGLVDDHIEVINLFDDFETLRKESQLEKTIDLIQNRYGIMSLQKATSLLQSSRIAERSQLIGGHSAQIKERKPAHD